MDRQHPGSSGAAMSSPSPDDLAKARERERRHDPGGALRRARAILREHSLDPAAFSNLINVFGTFGRAGAAGYLRGLGVPISAVRPIVNALPTKAMLDRCIRDRLLAVHADRAAAADRDGS